MPEPHPFRRAAEAKDLDLLGETLREDVELHSPILFRGFEGRDVVTQVLTHVAATLEDLTYVDELRRGQHRRPALQGPGRRPRAGGHRLPRARRRGPRRRPHRLHAADVRPHRLQRAEMAARLGVAGRSSASTLNPPITGGVSEWLKETGCKRSWLCLRRFESCLPHMSDLDGRVVAIAGVAGGLGPCVAERLAAAGATIAGDRRRQEASTTSARGSGIPDERWDGRAVDLLDEEAARAWCAALVERFGRVDGLAPPGRRLARRAAPAGGAARRLGPAARPPHPHRPAHDPRLPRRAARRRARPLRPRLLQAGAGANRLERRLRRGKGGRRGLDAGTRRRLRRHPRHRQRRRRRRDPYAGHARAEPWRGIPHLHARRAHRRGDRIPLSDAARKMNGQRLPLTMRG